VKLRTATVVVVMISLLVAGCTGPDEPSGVGTPSSSRVPSGEAQSSTTFEEAYRKLPMDGTGNLPITWETSQVPDTDEVLAARRSLVFQYWLDSSTDWPPVVPLGRFFYTERYYQEVLAPFINATDTDNPSVGPLWVKALGVEKSGPDQVTVTFCSDHGYWREVDDSPGVRKDRATVESYVMEYVQTGDGERRWLADRHLDPDSAREAKYGAECTKWAQHKP
jgi:hypothetical protein